VMGELTEEQIARLKQGVDLEDGPARVLDIRDGGGEGANHWYHVTLPEGRNREVRRMFEAVGLMVSRLLRTRYGPLHLPPQLKRGQQRELTPAEVKTLLAAVGFDKPAPPREAAPGAERDTGGVDASADDELDEFGEEGEVNGNRIDYQSPAEHAHAPWSRMRGSFDFVVPDKVSRRERYRSAAKRPGAPRKPKGR
jgi:hypothetical protein